MEDRSSRWPLTGGLGSILSSQPQASCQQVSVQLRANPISNAHLTLTAASGQINAGFDLLQAVQINLMSSLHYSYLQDYFKVVSRKGK